MIDLKQIQEHLIYEFSSEQELVNTINEMAHKFTLERDKIGDYVMSDKHVSAYCCFYMSTNIPKLAEVFRYIGLDFKDFSHHDIVDIGSGPGTYTLACLSELPSNFYYCVESSSLMRAQGEKIIQGIYPKSNVQFMENLKGVPKKENLRLGIFGHSANEMSLKKIKQYITQLDLDQILFIEPGTKEYFKTALDVRSYLIEDGFKINYPCPGQKSCPMSEGDWCHQFLKISHTDSVKRLCQLVKKDRSLLPISIQFYQKDEMKNHSKATITRVYKPTKFSIEMDLCQLREDGSNELIKAQQMTRKLKKPQIKKLNNMLAGEKVIFTLNKIIDGIFHRGDLDES